MMSQRSCFFTTDFVHFDGRELENKGKKEEGEGEVKKSTSPVPVRCLYPSFLGGSPVRVRGSF